MYFNKSKIVFQELENNTEAEPDVKHQEPNIDDIKESKPEEEEVLSPMLSVDETKSSRPIREKKMPTHLQDYDVYHAYCLLTSCSNPSTFQEAIKIDDWKLAIESELKSHEQLGTWEPAVLPTGEKAIDVKWVFNTKSDGTRKARLVAKGFQQPSTFDELNYAPVCRMSTLRILLTQVVNNNWSLKKIDVPTAFLNGTLEEEIFIKKPEGVTGDYQVCKLKRALYGLRLSSKCWNDTFNKGLEKFGLLRSQYDFCLYSTKDLYLLLFVDDAIITGSKIMIDSLISYLKLEFKIKDLGNAECFTGMEIIKTENHIKVHKQKSSTDS